MFHSVLVPIDGSVHSTCALVEAIELAVATGARLTVMTCMPSPARALFGRGYAFGVDMQDVRDAERDCRMLVNEAAATGREHRGYSRATHAAGGVEVEAEGVQPLLVGDLEKAGAGL